MPNLAKRICRNCGVEFMGGPRAWYCPGCRENRKKTQLREYKQRKAEGKTRPIGSIAYCEICGEKIIVTGGNHRFCKKCGPKHLAEVDRKQGLEWYNRNAAKINPKRMRKRNPQCYSPDGHRICKRCGILLPPETKRFLYCDNCRREISNEDCKKYYYRRKNQHQDAELDASKDSGST